MTTAVISDNTTGADFSGTDDVRIRQGTPTTNGDGNDLAVADGDGSSAESSLIRFTGLSNITGPVTVSAAQLDLWLVSSGAAGGRSIIGSEVLRNWGETTATYNTYDGTNNWTTAGATGSGDIDSTPAFDVGQEPTPTGEYRSFSSAALTQLVQDWINGVKTNNGLLLRATDTFAAWDFGRSEGTDGQRPKLTVTYTSGPARKPISDISVTGWTTTGGAVYSVIDEDTPSDADYATSPAITGSGQPAILGLQNTPLAAGTWAVAVRAAASTGTPTLRVKLLNDSNAEQGSTDVVVSTTPTRYDLTITTSGAATRISFEFIT